MLRVSGRSRLAGAVLALSASAALASESPSIPPALELPAGGLVFNSRERVVVDSELVKIALGRVEIDYVVRSSSSKPISLLVAFPLPVIDMANLFGAELAVPAYDVANPTNFVGFWSTIDGVPVEPDVDLRATALGQVDAGSQLRELGLPLYPLAPDLAEKLAALPPATRDMLEAANLISTDSATPEPLWALSTVFHWRHEIAADATAALRLHYQPSAGSAPWSEELKDKVIAKYCLTTEDVAAIEARAAGGKAPTVYWVHYGPAHNGWLKGESGTHTIIVEKPEGKGIATTCATGTREPTATGVRITTQNRIDDKEIQVLFVE